MNLKEIREIINLMNENELTEIEVEREGHKIKIKKSSADGGGTSSPVYSLPPSMHPAQPPAESAPNPKPADADRQSIKSPMVGTFYRAPSPESPPFVDIGEVVEVGQVVCIVEAMKLMNEIKSEVRGKVVEAPVENAQPVEFGQALFYIEPL